MYSFNLQLANFTTEILSDLCKSLKSSLSSCNILGILLNDTNSHINLYNWKGQSKQHAVYCNAQYKLCIWWLPTANFTLSQVHCIFHHPCTAFNPLNSHYCHLLVNFAVKCANGDDPHDYTARICFISKYKLSSIGPLEK
jgi:hypothetical protein